MKTQIINPKSLNDKIQKMRASKKPLLPSKTAESPSGSYSLENSLSIAERFKWLPEPLYAELKALPWSEAEKKRALLMLRFYFSKVYSSMRNDASAMELGYVSIHSRHWLNICSQRFYQKIRNHFFEALGNEKTRFYKKGESAIRWRLKKVEYISSLLSKDLPHFQGSEALEKNLEKISSSWDLSERICYMERKSNPIAELHYQNHLNWIEPIRKKLDEMENYQPIVDFLVIQGLSEEEAIIETNRFVQAAFWEYIALQNNERRFIEAGFNRFSRIHTPSNILKKNIEAFLIGESIYRFDIVSCHIAVLAAMSEDEALISDIKEGNDIYTKLCPSNREWAKQALLTLINDQETEVVNDGKSKEKVLPLQRKFESLYPVSAQYLLSIKKKNMSFSIIGCEIEQQFMRKATEILKEENPELLSQIKFEHDGIASLNLDAIKAFQNAFQRVLEEEWASMFKGIMKSKLSASKIDESGFYTEEKIEDMNKEEDNEIKEEPELTIDNMFDDFFSDTESLIETYSIRLSESQKRLNSIKEKIESYPKNEIPKTLLQKYEVEMYDFRHWQKQLNNLEKNKESEDELWKIL